MKNLISSLTSEKAIEVYGLIVLGCIAVSIVVLVAYYGNGVGGVEKGYQGLIILSK